MLILTTVILSKWLIQVREPLHIVYHIMHTIFVYTYGIYVYIPSNIIIMYASSLKLAQIIVHMYNTLN